MRGPLALRRTSKALVDTIGPKMLVLSILLFAQLSRFIAPRNVSAQWDRLPPMASAMDEADIITCERKLYKVLRG